MLKFHKRHSRDLYLGWSQIQFVMYRLLWLSLLRLWRKCERRICLHRFRSHKGLRSFWFGWSRRSRSRGRFGFWGVLGRRFGRTSRLWSGMLLLSLYECIHNSSLKPQFKATTSTKLHSHLTIKHHHTESTTIHFYSIKT